MAGNRLVTASDALQKFFKNVVAPWANQPGAPEPNMLRRKLVRNMAVWFAASPAPYRALHQFYVSGDDCAMVTFIMFLSVATKTGGLGTDDLARDVAEDMDHEIGLWMARVRDAPASGSMEDDLRTLLRKSAARLLDDARRLDEEPPTDADGKRAFPEAEKDLQKGLALVACTAIRLAFLTGHVDNFRDCLRALRQFSAGGVPSPDRTTEEDVESAKTWAQGVVENALAGVRQPIAEALARASGAEQVAEDAETMAVEAQKRVVAAEKRVAKAEKRVADLERRVGEMRWGGDTVRESTITDDRVAPLELMAANDGLKDRVVRLEKVFADANGRMMDRVAHMESAVRARVVQLESAGADVTELRASLARVQAEMGWLLPQFRMQFCHHWNGVMALWQMQHDMHTPYVPLPEFMPGSSH